MHDYNIIISWYDQYLVGHGALLASKQVCDKLRHFTRRGGQHSIDYARCPKLNTPYVAQMSWKISICKETPCKACAIWCLFSLFLTFRSQWISCCHLSRSTWTWPSACVGGAVLDRLEVVLCSTGWYKYWVIDAILHLLGWLKHGHCDWIFSTHELKTGCCPSVVV